MLLCANDKPSTWVLALTGCWGEQPRAARPCLCMQSSLSEDESVADVLLPKMILLGKRQPFPTTERATQLTAANTKATAPSPGCTEAPEAACVTQLGQGREQMAPTVPAGGLFPSTWPGMSRETTKLGTSANSGILQGTVTSGKVIYDLGDSASRWGWVCAMCGVVGRARSHMG